MNAERKKILDMLAEGKGITTRKKPTSSSISSPVPHRPRPRKPSPATAPLPSPAFCGSWSIDPVRSRSTFHAPGVCRTRSHLLAALPPRVTEKLADLGIDLSAASAMNDKEWACAMEAINIDIEKGNGEKVKVFCE